MAKCLRPNEIWQHEPTTMEGLKGPPVNFFYGRCGTCDACKQHRVDEWVLRMRHQDQLSKCSYFVTLTYDNRYLLYNANGIPQLSKRHLTKFRDLIGYYLKDINYKYLQVGEYGDNTFRPHYHAIYYLGRDLDIVKFRSACIFAWKKGFVTVDYVNPNRLRYLVEYLMEADMYTICEQLGIQPPFQLQSNGIGLEFAEQQAAFLAQRPFFQSGEIKQAIPRYYRKKLNIHADNKEFLKYQEEKINEYKKRDSFKRIKGYKLDILQSLETLKPINWQSTWLHNVDDWLGILQARQANINSKRLLRKRSCKI